jgi:hypothetical protein
MMTMPDRNETSAVVENAVGVETLAGLAVLATALSFSAPTCGAIATFVERTCTATVWHVQLQNSTARSAVPPLPPLPDHELDSPNFVPHQLKAFAARGFVRQNRWS